MSVKTAAGPQEQALQVLLELYASRPDLQEAYPEVEENDVQALINWAANTSTGVSADLHRDVLNPYAAWYLAHTVYSRPQVLWDVVRETCSIAENSSAIEPSLSVNGADALEPDVEDISEHLPILSMLVTEFRLKQILELGTRNGNSTLSLLAAAKAFGGKVFSIDIQPCELAQQRVVAAGLRDWWTFLHADDLGVPDSDIPEPTDLLFIDTRHTYNQLTAELKKYTPRLRADSWIAIHDYVSFPGMTKAVRDFIASRSGAVRFYPFANQSGLALMKLLA